MHAAEIEAQRQDKLNSLGQKVTGSNQYLQAHQRAKVATQLERLNAKAKQLKIDSWVVFEIEGSIIELKIKRPALAEASKLDGCYVLKTELSREQADAQTIHDRYKDLNPGRTGVSNL